MKQSITKEQWDELSDKKQLKFRNSFDKDINWDGVNIGQLIEFLGAVWFIKKNDDNWEVIFETTIGTQEMVEMPELIDALWEVTKHKLKS